MRIETVEDSPIGIEDKRNMPHFSIARLLLELNTELLKPLTSLFDISDTDSNMAESLSWLRVTVGVALEVLIRFGAMVVRQFKHAYR